MKIDLDAARAARKEAEGEQHVVTIGGRGFVVPSSPPLRALFAADENDISGFLKGVLGDEGYEAFMAANPTPRDLDVLLNGDEELGIPGLSQVYGIEMGNSSASATSSRKSGKRSRRTSKGSTESTSLKPVSGPAR